jgi:chromate transporter
MSFEIFWVFFKIGFMSFGGVFGVLPELERMIVIENKWITHDQFIQSYVMGQFLPGPNMVMCPIIGYWVNGLGGLIAGFIGIYSGPLLVMAAGFKVYTKYRDIDWVRRTEVSLRPLVFGLLGAAVLKLWWLQTAGPTTSLEFLFRFTSIFVCGIGIWLVQTRRLGPVSAVFAIGSIWWLTCWVVILQK